MNDNMQSRVTVERVTQLLECYGADPQTWPRGERAAALVLLQNLPELRVQWEDARKLDTLLHAAAINSDARTVGPVPPLLERLPLQESLSRKRRFSYPAAWGGAVAAALVLGLGLTYWSPVQSPTQTSEITMAQAEFERWMWDNLITAEAADPADDNGLGFMAMVELEYADSSRPR